MNLWCFLTIILMCFSFTLSCPSTPTVSGEKYKLCHELYLCNSMHEPCNHQNKIKSYYSVTSALLVLSYKSWLMKTVLKNVYRWYEKLVIFVLGSFVLKICIWNMNVVDFIIYKYNMAQYTWITVNCTLKK